MKTAVYILSLIAAGLTGYVIGTFEPVTIHDLLLNFSETACKVTRYEDGSIMCSIPMSAEDDDIRVFKGIQSTYNPQTTISATELQGE